MNPSANLALATLPRPHWRMCWRADGLKKKCLTRERAEALAARQPHLNAYACLCGCCNFPNGYHVGHARSEKKW